jgi:DNA-binding NtrC family response regulator
VNKKHKIFVVDDDPPMNAMLCTFIESQGFKDVSGFFSVEEMRPKLSKKDSVIIIQDFELPGINGLDCIKTIKPAYPASEFIFLSGQRSIQVAIDAIKYGAFDYIIKDNFAKENVIIKIKNLLRIKELEKKRKITMILFAGLTIILLLALLILLFTYRK